MAITTVKATFVGLWCIRKILSGACITLERSCVNKLRNMIARVVISAILLDFTTYLMCKILSTCLNSFRSGGSAQNFISRRGG